MKWKDLRRRCILWESTTINVLGLVEVIFGLVLLVPTAFALYFGEDVLPFAAPIPVLLALGMFQYLAFTQSRTFRFVNGLLLVGISWLVMFAIGTVPYVLSGIDPVNAVFESVSGITTTGLTVIGDLSEQSTSLLIWRSLTQWIGGIAVVLIFLYFLPKVGHGRGLFYNELAGYESSDYTQKTQNVARSFIIIYVFLSALNLVCLLLLGVSPIESMCLMFSTISTGGLLMFNSSLMIYPDLVQWVTIVFMFLGGTNFYLHYRALARRERGVYRRNSEFRAMVVWFAIITVAVFLLMLQDRIVSGDPTDLGSLYKVFKDVLFTTVSLGTSTGFYVEDYTMWPAQCTILLMIVVVIGASTSSTSGGIKIGRLRIIYEYIRNGFGTLLHTNSVQAVKIDGRVVDDSVIRSALMVFVMYVLTILIGAVLIMTGGNDLVDSLGLSISAVSNGGMGFGNFGPTGDFAALDGWIKSILVVLMWMGRLEIVTAAILFTPGFWKDVWLNSRARRRGRRQGVRRRSVPLAVREDVEGRTAPGGRLVYRAGHDAGLVVLPLLGQADAQGLQGADVLRVGVQGPGGVARGRLRVPKHAHDVCGEGVGRGGLLLEAGADVLDRLLVPPGEHEGGDVAAADVEVVGHLPQQLRGHVDCLGVVTEGAVDLGEHDPVERGHGADGLQRLEGQLELLHVLEAHAGEPPHGVVLLHGLQDAVGGGGVVQASEGACDLDPHLGVLRRVLGYLADDRLGDLGVADHLQE